MQVISAESTELFTGSPEAPRQLVRVSYHGCAAPTPVRVEGDGLAGETVADPGAGVVEVPVHVVAPVPGQRR